MAVHRVSAVFATRAEAERVARVLVSELHIPYAAVDVNPLGREPPMRYDSSNLWDAAAIGSKGSFFLAEARRRAYLEELRRGRMQLSALVDESDVSQATHLLEHSGALSLYDDERELKHEPDLHSNRQIQAVARPEPATMSESSTVVREGVFPTAAMQPTVAPEAVPRRRSRVRSYPVEGPGVLHEEATRDTTRHTGVQVDDQGQPVPKL